MMYTTPLLVYLLVVIASICSRANGTPIVQTPAGTFLGTENSVTVNGMEYKVNTFLGIPYAEPPVGRLRFKKPVTKAHLTKPYNATEFGAACNQIQLKGREDTPELISEDCLFLNVYVPVSSTSQKPTSGYSVMIWIHGGGFVSGGSNSYHADTLSSYGDVIVVTLNYRLALLGFFSTGDEHAPGNYGLWDQHLALQWVHDNIESFGGDPEKVTVFGESSGAASALFQGSYQGNDGLFQRVISESGTPTSPLYYVENPLRKARSVAHKLGCNDSFSIETSGLVECLLQIPSEEILEVLKTYYGDTVKAAYGSFYPTLDNDFVKVDPEDFVKREYGVYRSGHSLFASLDIMNGVNSAEGGVFIHPSFTDPNIDNFKINREEMEEFVDRSYPRVLKEMVTSQYKDWENPDDTVALRDLYVELNGDAHFVAPALEYSKKHSDMKGSGRNYLFQFAVIPTKHFFSTPSWLKGANHGDEVFYVFGLDPNMLAEYTPSGTSPITPEPWEYDLSKLIMTLWSNFAKTGNPNTPVNVTSNFNVTWPAFNLESQNYLKIDRVMSPESTNQHLAAKADKFWLTIVPEILKNCKQEYRLASSSSMNIPFVLLTFVSMAIYSLL